MRLNRISACAGIACVYLAFRIFIELVRPGHNDIRPTLFLSFIAFLTIAVLMLLQLSFAVSIAHLRLRPGRSALLALAGLCIFAGTMALLLKVKINMPIPAAFVFAIRDLSLMLFAASLGYTVSFIVREPNILLPASMFAAIVDYWGVTWGPLSVMLSKKPNVVAAASVQMPTPVAHVPGTMIGMGDFLFLALFFGVLYRFSLNVKGAFWLGYALLTASMFLVMVSDIALPALVPMGIAIVVTNYGLLKLRRQEKLATLYVGLFLLVLLIVSRVFFFRH